MEDQRVTISRVKYTNTYPASFMLVAAMNPSFLWLLWDGPLPLYGL